MVIRLEPNTSHCIETMARRDYKKVLGLLMASDQEDRQLEDRLELLRLFLESADFRKLRSCCDKFLLDGRRIEVRLKFADRNPGYEVEINEATGPVPDSERV